MAIVVNGKETLFDLDGYNNEAHSSNIADMEIYLDDEKISEAQIVGEACFGLYFSLVYTQFVYDDSLNL